MFKYRNINDKSLPDEKETFFKAGVERGER